MVFLYTNICVYFELIWQIQLYPLEYYTINKYLQIPVFILCVL